MRLSLKDGTSNRIQLTFTDYLKRTSFDGMRLCTRSIVSEEKKFLLLSTF
jgi:hypothetical protein